MTIFRAMLVWQSGHDQRTATEQLRTAVELQQITIDHLAVEIMPSMEAAQRLDTDRLQHEVNTLKAKLRAEEQRSRDIALQLEKLAQHRGPVLVPETEGLVSLQQECRKLDDKRQELEKRIEFLEGVRTANGERFNEMREQVWELRAGIAPEQVALQAERDFWRAKVVEMLKAQRPK